jgi:hypothetical protein
LPEVEKKEVRLLRTRSPREGLERRMGGGAKCVEENDQGKIGLGWSFLGLAGCWALSLTN